MTRSRIGGSFILLTAVLCTAHVRADDWPEFRGPQGNGVSTSKNLPSKWSSSENVAWSKRLPGKGWSSPSIRDGKIYLTAAVRKSQIELQVLCLDGKTGDDLWSTTVFKHRSSRIHGKNSNASPTPLVYGGRVYVHFGHQGTACLDIKGKVIWKNRRIKYSPVHGNGGSPILTDKAMVFSVDGASQAFVVALDRKTGKRIWKTSRKSKAPRKFSFTTPLLIDVNGKKQIVSPGSNVVCSYDANTGEELWRVVYDGYSVIPRPIFAHGLVYLATGYGKPVVYAIRPDGRGDVTRSHVEWTEGKGAPHTPSLLIVGNELYMVSDRGVASCLDAKTGKVHWQKRIGGGFSTSPVYADGKIFLQSEKGVGTVLAASKTFEKLGTNDIGERTLASYAIADDAIFIRSMTKLYRIEK